MSLRRGGYKSRQYRGKEGYVNSRVWRRRRAQFLAAVREAHGDVRCACCDEPLTDQNAHVHHLSYEGMGRDQYGAWDSHESDEDLLAMCAWCHERLHTLMDHDRGWSRMNRKDATFAVISVMQQKLVACGLAHLEQQTMEQ